MIWTVTFPTPSLYTLICSFLIRCTAFLAVAEDDSMFPPLGLCINCFLCPECISFFLLFFLTASHSLRELSSKGQGLNLDPQQWKHGVQAPGTWGNSPECFWIRQLYDSFHLFLHFLDQMSHSYCVLPSVSSAAQSCPTLCHPMNRSTPGLPVHHQLPEFTQTHVHRVSDTIQPSHPLSSPSPPAPNPSQHQSLFQWVSSSHKVAKVLEFQL